MVRASFGYKTATYKGEDGLLIERMQLGADTVVCLLLVDGHAGAEAAAHVLQEMVPTVLRACGDASPSPAALGAAVRRAFAECHAHLRNVTTSGTTVTLVIVNESRAEVTVASVGDSFAVLYENKPPKLSSGRGAAAAPHKTLQERTMMLSCNDRLEDNLAECERVLTAGYTLGRATRSDGSGPSGPLRAWPGGLACAKACGDGDVPSTLICAEPEIKHVTLPEHGGAIVLCTDGVWDAVDFELAGLLVLDAARPTEAAERLVKQALQAR